MEKLMDLQGDSINPNSYETDLDITYVSYFKGDKTVDLDGCYSSENLQHILKIMGEPTLTLDSYNLCPFRDHEDDTGDHHDQISKVEITEDGAILHRSCSCGGKWVETADQWNVDRAAEPDSD